MDSRNYLISFPRSGNTVMRLFLERYTQKPTSRCIIHDRVAFDGTLTKVTEHWTKGQDSSLLYPGRDDFVIWKTHGFPDQFQPKDGVVFLLRDYKDAILSFMKYRKNTTNLVKPLGSLSNEDYLKLEKCMVNEIDTYVRLVKTYHRCKNNKVLVRYENLIENGDKELERILQFLGLDVSHEKLRLCNPLNIEGKQEIDEWFRRVNGKGEIYANPGDKYIGKHKNYIDASTIKKLQGAVVSKMGKLHKLYTETYDGFERNVENTL